jgi:hypothetical protein
MQARLAAWRQAINAPMPTKNSEQGQAAPGKKGKKGKKKQQRSASPNE